MKRLMILIATLALAAPASAHWQFPWNRAKVPAAADAVPITQAQSEPPASLGATPTAPATPPVVAEVTGDPLLQLLQQLTNGNSADAVTAKQINELPGNGDKIMEQCSAFLQLPTTVQRLTDVLNFNAVLQIAPIKPVGPISALAEIRRAGNDVVSGALAARIADKRASAKALNADFVIACAPLIVDTRAMALRLTAILTAAAKGLGL
jgi:hypothetical protein